MWPVTPRSAAVLHRLDANGVAPLSSRPHKVAVVLSRERRPSRLKQNNQDPVAGLNRRRPAETRQTRHPGTSRHSRH